MKNSSDTVEIQTRDLPACSTMPQPTAPPPTPTTPQGTAKFRTTVLALHYTKEIISFEHFNP